MSKNDKKRPSRVTLATVADRAGVSIATVSLILSGREGWLRQFRPDTVQRVRKTAQRLGYRANLFASGLPTKASPFFALVVHDVASQAVMLWHHWAFEGAFMAGVIQTAADRGMYPILATAGLNADEERILPVQQIVGGGVYGAIVRSPSTVLERFLRGRLKRGLPIVVVFPQRLSAWKTNVIDMDNIAVGETAAQLLAERGRKRWVLVCYKTLQHSWRLRISGFKRVAKKVGASVSTISLPRDVDEESAADRLVPRIKRSRADGIFAIDSISSVGSLLANVKTGARPAEDFDLVGCDCDLWRSESLPSITAVNISWRDVGALAMQKLAGLSQAGKSHFDIVLLKPRIVPAGTCPIPAHMA